MSPSPIVRSVSPLLALALGSALASFATAQITPGNLVVVRVGDGAAALTSAANAVFYEEYTPAGTLVQTMPLPTAVSGSNRAITNSGSATSEGFLSLSTDGRYLVSVGYDAAPGTASVVGTSSATVNRVIARVGIDGSIDTSTALGDAYSANNIRSATTNDGTQFWTAGTASTTGGIRHVAGLGATTSTQLSTTITNTRVVGLFGGQLYTSSATGTFLGLSTVGTGTPTTSGQTITLLPGFGAAGSSSYDYFFADANTLYVADDRNNGNGGIQKWTLSAGTWSLQYTLIPGTNLGCRGLSGSVEAGVATLYATTTETTLNRLVLVTDTGPASTFSTVATAGVNQLFRGVRFICAPATVESFGAGTPHTTGTPSLSSTGMVIGTNSTVTATSMLANDTAVILIGLRIPPVDLSSAGAQPGSELYLLILDYVGVPTDGAGTGTLTIAVPNSTSLCGADFTWQALQIDFALPFALPIAQSQGLTTRIGL